ncbi:hypothetical protein FACS189434_06630 [Bacteroidia bacterium]|nr:hypothetical protein FACS189434_06630 [Bacteroidia bacterium]
MKILKNYDRGLRCIEYTYEDRETIIARMGDCDSILVNELINFMQAKNEKIIFDDIFDPRSYMTGVSIYIMNCDLSVNGYCLSDDNIKDFLSSH